MRRCAGRAKSGIAFVAIVSICLTSPGCRGKEAPAKEPFNPTTWVSDKGDEGADESPRHRQIDDVTTKVLKRNLAKQKVLDLLGKPNNQADGDPWRNDVAIAPPTPHSTWMYHICLSGKDTTKEADKYDFMLLGFDEHDNLVWITRTGN